MLPGHSHLPQDLRLRKTQYQLEHYIDLLERKPRSVFQAKPVKENVTQELLEWGRRLPGGNKEMVKLLRLCVDYGEEYILAIKHSLPGGIVPTVDMIGVISMSRSRLMIFTLKRRLRDPN